MNILKGTAEYLKVFLKWTVIAVVVGAVGGAIGSIFHKSIDYATEFRAENTWILFFLPIGGLAIAFLYKLAGKKGRIDTNRVLDATRGEGKVPLIMAPLIFVSTVLTHFLGGSAGREGAALQLGGSIGYNIGRIFRLRKDDSHIIVMSGMSSVFAALFGTPLTAAVFSLEVINAGVFHYGALVPCIIASIVASRIAVMFGLHPVCFDSVSFPVFTADIFLKAAILAILCAIVSILFCTTIKKCEHMADKLLPNVFIRAFIGGSVIVALTVLLGTYDYNGAGMEVVSLAIGGEAKYEAFLLKIIFTAITISAGFKGGEIVPAFFVGSTFGCVAGAFLGLNPGFSAALGFIALFCGVVNCPLASIILSLEVFGGEAILIFALVCGVSYMMSGYFGLYKSQKFSYSKLSDELIDLNAK